MKRKLLIGLVGVTATVGIVGSGFSAWYFGHEDLVTAVAGVKTHVTNVVENVGTLTDNNANQKLTIVLDQGGYTNKADKTKGISFVDTSGIDNITDDALANAPKVDSLSATYTIDAKDVNNLVNAGIKSAQFIAHIYFNSNEYRNYIDFRSDYVTNNLDESKAMFSNGTLYYFETINFTLDTPINQTFEFTTKTTDGVNDMLTYVSKPTTKDDYDKMKNALNGKGIISVQYTVQI